MSKRPISEEMLNAFVDRQLCAEDRLRVLRSLSRDHGLSQDICDRQRVKELVSLAYGQGVTPAGKAQPTCRSFPWRWWRHRS